MEEKEIVAELERLMASGDEAATRQFIFENFQKLPSDTQKSLAADMLESALDESIAGLAEVESLKADTAAMIQESEQSTS